MSRLSRLLEFLEHGPAQDAWWEKERERVDRLWDYERQGFPACVVGTDEVGRGPMAGPLIAAAATCRKPVFVPGLDDSKKLTCAERELVAELIAGSEIQVKLEIISVETISQGNLHHLSLLAMQQALRKLKVRPKLVLVDGKYPLPGLSAPQRPIIGGDRQSALIAAASIVAKVTRDRIMRDLAKDFPVYGWEHNVGYCTVEHRKALQRYGATPHHRSNYKPVKQQLPSQLTFEHMD